MTEQDNPPSAMAYGAALQGLGINIIVRDIDRAHFFVTEILSAETRFRTDKFAAMRLCGDDFMLHVDDTYRNNPLIGSLTADSPRGVGVELRAYAVNPDQAEARARALGFTVLAGSMDKPHGMRECMILDDDGYVWIPSLPQSG
ncbi:VOC family protein [Aestuariivirga litoralis]|uniref:VOC family protein n=1 Tax=Aestuariivirga litoralis TaxID=2650924 RepID=UPI0018C45C74|nr:hypothetical protein [Aestuariivirga litoralis]MBG1233636.1 hypothetical protein [Aestuariivirga litoralis]